MAKTVPMIAAKAFPFRTRGRLAAGDRFEAPSERDARVLHTAGLAKYDTKVMRAEPAPAVPQLPERPAPAAEVDAIPVFGTGALETKAKKGRA